MIGPYWVGDKPTTSIAIESDAPLDDFDSVTVTMRDPLGTVTPLAASLDAASDRIVAQFPDGASRFIVAGIYTLSTTLGLVSGEAEHAADTSFVVEAFTGWHTLASAREQEVWARNLSDVVLYTLLTIAREQCEDYAPAYTAMQPPLRYLQAQLMQARNTWNANRTDPSDAADSDLYVIRPYPLDNFVRQVLRPKRAHGLFGGA